MEYLNAHPVRIRKISKTIYKSDKETDESFTEHKLCRKIRVNNFEFTYHYATIGTQTIILKKKRVLNMKKKFVPILAAGALIVVIICFMLLGSIIEKYTPSKEHMNLSDYYNLSGEQDVALILDNQILDAKENSLTELSILIMKLYVLI